MKVILFGATGMVGQGALKACLADSKVTGILVVGRTALGEKHKKLKEIIHQDFTHFTSIKARLNGYDACFFCLGVSSAGMSEKDYRHITYDFTLAAARVLAQVNRKMTFIYVSGAGTDSTEKGRTMWARVKGETENALLKLPFKAAYMFRPGGIEPLDGIVPKNKWLRILLTITKPLIPLLKKLFPRYITTTRQLGKAMIVAAQKGAPNPLVEIWDINRL